MNVLLFVHCIVKQIVCVYVWECSYIFYEIYAKPSVFRWQMVHMCDTFSKYSTCLLKGGQEVQVELSWLIYIVQIIGNMGKNPQDLPWFSLFYLLGSLIKHFDILAQTPCKILEKYPILNLNIPNLIV